MQWGAAYSEFVKIKKGMRQGSVLIPYLFAVYVDKLLQKLKASGRGCHIKSFCFNSVMYADDLLLLSVSIMDMQMLINICTEVLAEGDLEINCQKTSCLRIGPRHNYTDCELYLNNVKLHWKSEIRYLGIQLLGAKNCKCNLQ